MKRNSTTPVSSPLLTRLSFAAIAVVFLVATLLQFYTPQLASADSYEEKISAIQKEIEKYNEEADKLSKEADSYQTAINKFNNEIATVQQQINLSTAKKQKLDAHIEKTKERIKRTQEILGRAIVDIEAGELTPLEIIASGENVGDIIDAQSQHESIRDELGKKVADIKKLKKKLEVQKRDVERIIKDQKSQRQLLASKQKEQQDLKDKTKGEEAAYNELANKRNGDIQSLRAQQAEENRRAMEAAAAASGSGNVNIPPGIPGGGGYPGVWANAPINAYVDPWGLYSRQCVSYVAWKVHSTNRFVPHFGGYGNANQWPSTTSRHGISSGSIPKAGAAAVSMAGYYGHVMYVESVNGDGSITVSDYNFGWDGLYRKYSRSSSGLTYIYF